MAATPTPLTTAEKEQFLQHGFIRVKNCFTRDQAEKITGNVWTRLGMDPEDKTTWTALRTNMPSHNRFDAAEFAPRAWAAICELCGGEERILPESRYWRDSLIVNLGSPEFEGKDVKPQDLQGWHVDGDFFVHYLDSAEQGLLVIPLFTDIKPGGGGTAICPEAIPKMAKHLYDHPEGVSPRMRPRAHPDFVGDQPHGFLNDVAKSCEEFAEAAGECGDVFLLHPLMLHSASTNPLRHLRIITNPPISLREPFQFHRQAGDYSLVELTTLRALGKESLPDWKITAPREKRIPERLKMQARMKEEEEKRLRAAQSSNVTV